LKIKNLIEKPDEIFIIDDSSPTDSKTEKDDNYFIVETRGGNNMPWESRALVVIPPYIKELTPDKKK